MNSKHIKRLYLSVVGMDFYSDIKRDFVINCYVIFSYNYDTMLTGLLNIILIMAYY